MWIAAALGATIIQAVLRLEEQHVVRKTKLGAWRYGWSKMIGVVTLFTVWLIFVPTQIPPFTSVFWLCIAAVVFIFYPIFSIFYQQVLASGRIADVVFLTAFIPVITLIIGAITGAQVVTGRAVLGVGLITLSILIIMTHGKPWKLARLPILLASDTAFQKYAICVVLMGFAVVIDSIGVRNSSPQLYGFTSVFSSVVMLALFDVITSRTKRIRRQRNILYKLPVRTLAPLNLVEAAGLGLYFLALSLTTMVAYVSAVRNLNIMLVTMIDAWRKHHPLAPHKFAAMGTAGAGIWVLIVH